jgi:hypothetical protein
MSAKMRLTTAIGMVLFVFLLSAVTTVPALADDGIPPAEAPIVTEPQDASSDPEPVDETEPVSSPDPEPAPVEEAESAPVEETLSGEELLSDLPEGTEVVVLDEQGETVPLVTEEAAEIIAVADPMWCPAGVTPGAATCSFSYANLKLLFDNLMNGTAVRGDGMTPLSPAGNGVIWITGYATSGFAADTSAAAIILNGSDPDVASILNFSLTLKGGWTGTGTTINTADASVFNKTISIINWQGDVTLSDIVISGTTGGDGLTVTTTKNIALTRVQSNSNAGKGAELNSTAGTGKITVTSSQFNLNGGVYGLQASSNGIITLSNVTASGNSPNGYGAYLDNGPSPSKAGVTLSGVNTFNDNQWDGLVIYSSGAILANDVTANGNGTTIAGGGGASLYNAYAGVTAGVTLTGTSNFSDNFSTGLTITTNGAIKASNVIANSNNGSGRGAYLNNSSASTPQPITLTGNNQFKYNTYGGLMVVSKGLITLNNITANGATNGNGLDVDQCILVLGSCTASGSGGLKLTGTNVFNDNSSYGIFVDSVGALTLNNVTANRNGLPGSGYGAFLLNTGAATPKSVTLTGTNVFDGNKNGGLYISSNGAIKVNNITASNNVSGPGAYLINANTGASGGVTVSGTNFFNNNYSTGFEVVSYGAISLSSTQATENGLLASSGSGVVITNTGGGAQPVTLSGINDFSGNYATGLVISSAGVVKLNSVTSSNSDVGYGASVSTSYNSTTVYSFVLSGTNVFNSNPGYGLYLNATGMISLNNVTASNNHNVGLYAFNTASGISAPRNVVMTGVNFFNDNWFTGLAIESYGSITLANVTASGNGQTNGYGANLYNAGGMTPKSVTLTGTNVFNGNYNTGLYVFSLGAIAVSNVTANDNGVVNDNGAYLNNNDVDAVGGVTLSGVNTFTGNNEEGLIVSTRGAITVNSLRASNNGTNSTHEGAQLSNSAASSPQPVTLTGVSEFNGNFGYGLSVFSLGQITASNLTANDNQTGAGVSLYNDLGSSTAGVTLTGVNTFNDNWFNGLEVGSFGTINLLSTQITANGNGLSLSSGYGVTLVNSTAATPKSVKIGGTNIFNENYQGGLNIESDGAITTNNLTANSNTSGSGANLNNAGGGAAGSVTLTGTNSFNTNYNTGLVINSLGAITASNVTASDTSNGYGAILANNGGAGGVTLSGKNTFNGNDGTGLDVTTTGAITLNNVTASQNGQGGSGYGAFLSNTAASGPQAVKLTGTNTFDGNETLGLYVDSLGAITINNLSASYTVSGGGAQLFNTGVGAVGNVTLTGVNTFNENNGTGLHIGSKGNVSVTKVTADGNTGDGLYTNPTGTITLTCGSFTNNTGYGWRLTSLAGITLKGVFSAGNSSGDTWFGTVPVVTRNCPLP